MSKRHTEFFPKELQDKVAIVRVSPIHCHTPEDVDRFLKVTKQIAESKIVLSS